MYKSTKILQGFSACFRQWKAVNSHCSKLHGYALKFKITFASNTLDEKNWVMDFGLMKNLRFKHRTDGHEYFGDWMKWMFDHTTVVAQDDPFLGQFMKLNINAVFHPPIDLRTVEAVGCERFAKMVFEILQYCKFPPHVKIESVECIENDSNSAIYHP